MKVSEVIDRLKVGDEVWVKGEVLEKDDTKRPLYLCLGWGTYKWLHEEDEISLTEPQAEKVEVPAFVAPFIEKLKTTGRRYGVELEKAYASGEDADLSEWLWFNKNVLTVFKALENGYEVEKEPKWIVKYIPPFVDEFRYYSMDDEIFDITESSWTSDKEDAYPFPEKEKAEALAVLVDGSVEEV